MKRIFPLLLLPFLVTAAVADEAYRIVHPDGTVEFTDEHTAGAQPIPLPQPQTYTPPPMPKTAAGKATERKTAPAKALYQVLAIVQPSNEGTVRNDSGEVGVTVSVRPQLRTGDQVVLFLDGNRAVAGPQIQLRLENVYRGSHTLRAEVQDQGGTTLISSPAITFYEHRHSIAH